MTNELACTWPELKIRVKQFYDFLPLCKSIEELDQIFKMVGLSYLNLEGTENEKFQASILWRMCLSEYLEKELDQMDMCDEN